jgi:GNAT superfamily N-acetyltransferase
MVSLSAVIARLGDIEPLRALFLQEMNCQIRYNARHERGWTDSYLLKIDGVTVGYGSIMGQERHARDTVFELFVIKPFRQHADELLRALVAASRATTIECQSNDTQLTRLAFAFAKDLAADVALFDDHVVTTHVIDGALVRRRRRTDRLFEHTGEPEGDYVVDIAGDIVATGGFLLHYNPPFADIYMEVREDVRRRGVGTFLVQELKRECYLAGRVPAARCSIENAGSRGALTRAGMRLCGVMLKGSLV